MWVGSGQEEQLWTRQMLGLVMILQRKIARLVLSTMIDHNSIYSYLVACLHNTIDFV